MGIVANLMQGNQLVGKGVGIILVDILFLEADRVVEIRPLGHGMMAQRIEMRWHRVYGCES